MTTTFDGLRDIIVRDFELAPERLRRDTALEEIELDSLAITELVFALEDEFHVTAGNVNPSFKNLGDIADYIDHLIVERDAAPKAGHAATPKTASAAAAKSPPAARAKSAAATRASGAKTSRSAGNGAKAGAPKRAATNGAQRANGGKPAAAGAAGHATPPRKRKRVSATTTGARAR
jgi:acyl carrier protein